jgi:GH25 family lysozyme M1 (1,4-beta-N-acetylmuramidase)
MVVACLTSALIASTLTATAATAATTSVVGPSGATATPTPAPAGTTEPDGTPTPTTAPTPAAPAAPAAPGAPASPQSEQAAEEPTAEDTASTSEDPSLAEMNAAGDHAMGSTVPVPAADRSLRTQLRSANSSAVPGTDGLDISAWQPNSGINWPSVYQKGARFVYIKASESTTYTSSQFTAQWNSATKNNLIRGAYHFALPNKSTGATQANYFGARGGGWSTDGRTLPPLLDIEYNPYSGSDGTNSCYGLSQAQMVAWIRDFSNTMKARTGVLPAIYTTTDWWRTCTGNSAAFAGNALFIARYPTNLASGAGTLPASWAKYTMWQYASSGTFPGDQDVFNGSLSQLQAFARGSGSGSGSGKPLPAIRSKLVPNDVLSAGQGIISGNDQYTVKLQSDGQFVTTGNGRAIWKTGVSSPGARVTFVNGDLAVKSPADKYLWHTKTNNSGADNVVITSSGDLQVRRGTTVIWRNGRPASDSLAPVARLYAGQWIVSRDAKTKLLLRSDGNLVLSRGSRTTWTSGTAGNRGAHATLQAGGDFVLFNAAGRTIWHSGTAGKKTRKLAAQDNGDLVMTNTDRKRTWHTNTAGK